MVLAGRVVVIDAAIGNGNAARCTPAAVVRAVAKGGVVTFRCGPSPVTIVMRATAKVRNTSSRVVIDGGGNTYHRRISGSVIKFNYAREGGGAIFFEQ